jgi:hypothetical protein
LPSGVDAAATTGRFKRIAPADPANTASPNANTPPSDATNQYPLPSGVDAAATTGRFRCIAPADPANTASPNANIPPSDATNR